MPPPAVGAGAGVADGAFDAGADVETRYGAATPPETPPTITPARRNAAARAPLTSGLAPRQTCGFGCRARRGPAASRRRPDSRGLDHLADRRRAHLQIDVGVRLDINVPAAGDLELLVH